MSATDSIRIRLDPDFKDRVVSMYLRRGTTVSAAVRAFLAEELEAQGSAVDAFDAIMASADAKAQSSSLGEPSIDDIRSYVARVRAERAADALAV